VNPSFRFCKEIDPNTPKPGKIQTHDSRRCPRQSPLSAVFHGRRITAPRADQGTAVRAEATLVGPAIHYYYGFAQHPGRDDMFMRRKIMANNPHVPTL
jgi:hypothetical protein